MSIAAAELRSLYRRFLRELPVRSPSILANPSPVQKHIRLDLESASTTESSSEAPSASLQAQTQRSYEDRVAEAEQYLQYVKSQRVYATLIERYNPGMNMEEEERIRLTARRVGMDLPVEAPKPSQKD